MGLVGIDYVVDPFSSPRFGAVSTVFFNETLVVPLRGGGRVVCVSPHSSTITSVDDILFVLVFGFVSVN